MSTRVFKFDSIIRYTQINLVLGSLKIHLFDTLITYFILNFTKLKTKAKYRQYFKGLRRESGLVSTSSVNADVYKTLLI